MGSRSSQTSDPYSNKCDACAFPTSQINPLWLSAAARSPTRTARSVYPETSVDKNTVTVPRRQILPSQEWGLMRVSRYMHRVTVFPCLMKNHGGVQKNRTAVFTWIHVRSTIGNMCTTPQEWTGTRHMLSQTPKLQPAVQGCVNIRGSIEKKRHCGSAPRSIPCLFRQTC